MHCVWNNSKFNIAVFAWHDSRTNPFYNGSLLLVIYTNTITFPKTHFFRFHKKSEKLQIGSLPNFAQWVTLWWTTALSIFIAIGQFLPKWRTTFTFGHFFHFSGQNWHIFVNNFRTEYRFALILVLKVAVTYWATAIAKKIFFWKSIMAPQAAKDLRLKLKNSKFSTLELHNSALLH